MKTINKTKINKLSNESLAIFSLRIIDAVTKTENLTAINSKQFQILKTTNDRYQNAIDPVDSKTVSKAIESNYNKRSELFQEMYTYLNGQTNSPDDDIKTAALKVFKVISVYGPKINNVRLSEQSLRYNHLTEALKNVDLTADIEKLKLSNKVLLFIQLHKDYEESYVNRGDVKIKTECATKVKPEMLTAIKMHVDEVLWLAKQNDSESLQMLYLTIVQRLEELSVNNSTKGKDTPENDSNVDSNDVK